MINSLLITRSQPLDKHELNDLCQKLCHKNAQAYFFFYGDAVIASLDAAQASYWQELTKIYPITLNICRTALLRRQLITDDMATLATPWQLAGLYEFYDHLKAAETCYISTQQSLSTIIQKHVTQAPRILFAINALPQFYDSNELIELIIGASLSFEVHVSFSPDACKYLLRPEMSSWLKPILAMHHYDITLWHAPDLPLAGMQALRPAETKFKHGFSHLIHL